MLLRWMLNPCNNLHSPYNNVHTITMYYIGTIKVTGWLGALTFSHWHLHNKVKCTSTTRSISQPITHH